MPICDAAQRAKVRDLRFFAGLPCGGNVAVVTGLYVTEIEDLPALEGNE